MVKNIKMSVDKKILQEIQRIKNINRYILNEQEQLVGYIKTGTKEYIQFSKPMKQFSKSRRQFKELIPVEKYIGETI